MLMTIMAAVIFLGLLFAGMAIGVILSNKPLQGSCGGLANLGLKEGCEICGGDPQRCESTMEPAPVRQYDPNQDDR